MLAARGLAKFILVAIPGALLIWVEWWAFEALTIFVGMLPNATTLLAAHGTMFNSIVNIVSTRPMGQGHTLKSIS